MTCTHNWKYRHARVRDGIFHYPFPVWVAARVCSACQDAELLFPRSLDLNDKECVWVPEVFDAERALNGPPFTVNEVLSFLAKHVVVGRVR